MDSSQDDNYLPPSLLNNNNEHKCEELFDQLFLKNDENELNDDAGDDYLNVIKPKRTYNNVKTKIVRFNDDNFEEDDDDDGDGDGDEYLDENHKPLFDEDDENDLKKKKKRKVIRKKKLLYPNVSKDAVLKAFEKAIETKELPDFDEIEKFPLEIVVVEKNKRKMKKSTKKSIKINKNQENNKNQKENLVEVENGIENNKQQRNIRRSNRKFNNVLIEKNPNLNNNNNNNRDSTKNLFNLDESFINGDGTTFYDNDINKNTTSSSSSSINGMMNKKAMIKSSTPFH